MKVKFGAIVVDGRNKVGGHVLSKNRGGAYMRTKVTPVNPQSVDQSAVRGTLTTFSQNWRGLTEDQRTAWNAAVQNFKKTDIFGDIKTPSGINLYVKLNSTLAVVGSAPISDPPADTTSPGETTTAATVDATTPALSIVFTPTPVPAGSRLSIECTAPQSAGKSFIKNQYRVIATVNAAGTSPHNTLAAYVAKFGPLVVGQKVGVRTRLIDTLSGVAGPYSYDVQIAI